MLIAEKFVEDLCARMGRPMVPLSEEVRACLLSQQWPGNVRELQNVLERALITARPGMLDLERAMPSGTTVPCPEVARPGEGAVLTMDQLQELERANAIKALEQCGWKISGEDGAAVVLGMKPSTLTSRLKALGVERPR